MKRLEYTGTGIFNCGDKGLLPIEEVFPEGAEAGTELNINSSLIHLLRDVSVEKLLEICDSEFQRSESIKQTDYSARIVRILGGEMVCEVTSEEKSDLVTFPYSVLRYHKLWLGSEFFWNPVEGYISSLDIIPKLP